MPARSLSSRAVEVGTLRRELLAGEWAVLALLAEHPSHGFAIARLLAANGDVGHVWSMTRPRVYRAIEDLRGVGFVEVVGSTPSTEGPSRTQLAPTAAGREALKAWMRAPVAHVRDARSELLLKLVLSRRAGEDLAPLATAQLQVLDDVRTRLVKQLADAPEDEALVLRFRLAQTEATIAFVRDLAG